MKLIRRILRLLPSWLRIWLRTRWALYRYPEYRRIPEFDLEYSGVAEDGTPFVTLRDGFSFYSHPPTPLQNSVVKTVFGGYPAHLDPRCYGVVCDIAYRYFGPKDPKDHLAAGKYFDFKPGQVVVEVGAFVGHFTLRAAELVGESGRVVAVEAIEENYRLVQRNVTENNLSHVTVFHCAAWKEKGTITLVRESEQKASIVKELIHGDTPHEVPCNSIDGLMEELDLIPDFVRIQVNGAEMEVLEGMERLLVHRPKILIAAIYQVDGLASWKRVVPWLEQRGYKTKMDGNGMVLAE